MRRVAVSRSQEIQATAERIWQILVDDFADADRWVTSVQSSTGDAEGRVCEVAGFGLTDERITHRDPDQFRFGYTIAAAKLPGFVRDARNAWVIEPVGAGRALVTSEATADITGLLGPLMAPVLRRKLRGTLDQIFEDLRAYAETGQVSAAKQRAIASH